MGVEKFDMVVGKKGSRVFFQTESARVDQQKLSIITFISKVADAPSKHRVDPKLGTPSINNGEFPYL